MGYDRAGNCDIDILVGHGAFLENNGGINFSIIEYEKAVYDKFYELWKNKEISSDGKPLFQCKQLLKIFFADLKRQKSLKIEQSILGAFQSLVLNEKMMDFIFNRSLDTWMTFSTVLISPFCENVKPYDGKIKSKIESFKNVFTTNYQMNGIEGVKFLHGKYFITNNNINYSLVLVPNSKNKNEFVNEICRKIENEVKDRLERRKDIKLFPPFKTIPSKYSDENLFLLKKCQKYLSDDYENIQSDSREIVIFGFSPFGDNSLIEKIKAKYEVIHIVLHDDKEKSEFIKVFSSSENVINFIEYKDL